VFPTSFFMHSSSMLNRIHALDSWCRLVGRKGSSISSRMSPNGRVKRHLCVAPRFFSEVCRTTNGPLLKNRDESQRLSFQLDAI
jgi:hypothetical protein